MEGGRGSGGPPFHKVSRKGLDPTPEADQRERGEVPLEGVHGQTSWLQGLGPGIVCPPPPGKQILQPAPSPDCRDKGSIPGSLEGAPAIRDVIVGTGRGC